MRYHLHGGDYDVISTEDVEYDPETMFRFRVGSEYYVIHIDDLRQMIDGLSAINRRHWVSPNVAGANAPRTDAIETKTMPRVRQRRTPFFIGSPFT